MKIVVVAYHSVELLDDCLARLDPNSVIVVDNSSSDVVRECVTRWGCSYDDPGTNLGFGAAVNRATHSADAAGHDILLVNPDSVVSSDMIQGLIEHLADDPGVAAISPRLRDPGGREQRVAWPFPSPRNAWLEAFKLSRWHARDEWVVGAVMLLRAEALREVGDFDERYFLYAEETDWQRRATIMGWKAVVANNLEAIHVGAATSQDSIRRELLFHAAQETYVRKWFGTRGWYSYRAAVIVGAAIRSLLPGPQHGPAWRRLGLYLTGPRRRAFM